MDLEETTMMLIVNAGACRSLLMQALRHSRAKEFDQAEQLINEAKDALHEAHAIQTKLIEDDEGEGKLKVNIIMVHAQDHLMNAVQLLDLIEEFVEIHKRLPA